MPWHIESDNPDCSGYAVVKDEDGTIEGCHQTQEAARRQLAALYASETTAHRRPPMLRFTSDQVTVTAQAGPTGQRRIDAVAVPYNVWATVSDGTQVKFMPGSLPVEGKAPRVFMYHDSTMPVGIVAERVDTEEAMLASMKISRTRLGDDALELAADGVMDVSVGVNPIKADTDNQGRVTVYEAEWIELSLVPVPAFAGSVITEVAAAATVDPVTAAAATLPDDNAEPQPQEKLTVEATPAPAESVEAAAIIPTAPIHAEPRRAPRMPSAAEYMAAMHIGGDTFAKVNQQYREFVKANQSAFEAAAGDTLTTDVDGLLPVPVLGTVFQDINYIRPFIAAVGTRAYPDNGQSKTFIRPTWQTHPSVSEQSTELTGASATTPVIADNVVQKKTFAGQVTLSVQTMDFTSPGAMEIILSDLAGQYAVATDNYAVDTFVTGAYSAGTWDGTVEDFINDIYLAAQNIAGSGRNYYPTHMLVGIDTWKKIGSLVDDNKRPVFPYIGQANLNGQNTIGGGNVTDWSQTSPLGLQLIVDTNVAAKTMVIFNARAAEYYEQVRGIMSREDPSTLGRTFSYYGYASFFLANQEYAQKFTWS